MKRRMITWRDLGATDVAKKHQFKYLTKNAENKYIVRNMWSNDRFNWSWYHILHTKSCLVSNKIREVGPFYCALEDGTLIWGREVYPAHTDMLSKFKFAYANYLNYLGYVTEWDINTFEEEGYREFKEISDRYKEEHPGVVYSLNI